MAHIIDLRNSNVQIRDGYSAVGAINQTPADADPGPEVLAVANGDTSFSVDGFTAEIPIGVELRIEGVDAVYIVTEVTGGSTPTAITFTPALSTAAGIPVDNADVTVGPNFVDVHVGEGTCSYDEKRKMEYTRNKRRIYSVRTGDEEPMDVSLDFLWEYLSSVDGEPVTIEEAVKQEGAGSTWVTSGSDPCEPYSVDILISYIPPCTGEDTREDILLKEYRWESFAHDVKAGTVVTKGMCKIPQAVKTRI